MLTTLASFAVFVGTALLYQSHRGINLAQLQRSLARPRGSAAFVALGLLIGGYATKAALRV